jgi:hypothetical protein
MTFKEREEHLQQRVARGWNEDEDIITCMMEIDRLRRELGEMPPLPPMEANRECATCGEKVVCMNCYARDAEEYAEARFEHGSG